MANLKNNTESTKSTNSPKLTKDEIRLQAYTEMNAIRAESKLHGVKTQEVADCLGMSLDSLYNVLSARAFNSRSPEQYNTIAATYRMLIDKKIADKKNRKPNAKQIDMTEELIQAATTDNIVVVLPEDFELKRGSAVAGVTRRDYFAVTILNNIYATNTQRTGKEPEAAVKIADKLISELKKS